MGVGWGVELSCTGRSEWGSYGGQPLEPPTLLLASGWNIPRVTNRLGVIGLYGQIKWE